MPFFDPGVDAPAGVGGCVGLGGADLAAVQRGFEVGEETEIFGGVGFGLGVEEGFDVWLHGRLRELDCAPSARGPARRPVLLNTCSILARLAALGRNHRQTVYRFEQAHQAHGGLHRNRIRLDEVDLHQREVSALQFARGFEIVAQRRLARVAVISAGISLEATEMMPRPPSAISGMVMASSPESTMKSSGHVVNHGCHLRDVAGGFFDADDVFDLRRGAPAWRARR